MNRHIILLISILFLLAGSGWGQEPAANPPQPALGPELPYTEALTPPMPVSGVRMPLTFTGESARSNFVTGSVQVSTAYDDNILTSPNHHLGDVSYLLAPALEIGQSMARWQWNVGYSPGFTVNQRFTERNQATHSLYLLTSYRLSPHVALQLHDNFEKTNTLFSGLQRSTQAPGPGVLQQPNTSLVIPLANLISNSSGLDLTYQFSPTSMVGASGSYYFVNYGSVAANTPSGLLDSRSWMTDGFYAHRFANRQWTGLTYNFQKLIFDLGARANVNRILWFYSVPIGSHMTLSFWAGPEYSKNLARFTTVPSGSGLFFSHSQWCGAGGVSWAWQGSRTTFSVGYRQQTSDGGGLAQAVKLQSADVQVSRRLTPRWFLDIASAYAQNTPIGLPINRAPFRSWMGNVGLDYRIADNLGLGLRYGRDQLRYVYPGAAPTWGNRNQAWLSLSYSFTRPLGR